MGKKAKKVVFMDDAPCYADYMELANIYIRRVPFTTASKTQTKASAGRWSFKDET